MMRLLYVRFLAVLLLAGPLSAQTAQEARPLDREPASLRQKLLALKRPAAAPERRLYVLDKPAEPAEALFEGLSRETNSGWFDRAELIYLADQPAIDLAERLNIAQLPAAVLTDAHYTVLGVLSRPESPGIAAGFLADPSLGHLPEPPAVAAGAPSPLRDGIPAAWLVGGLHDGRAGLSIYGLDAERSMRPSAGQTYLETRMMGGAMRQWHDAASADDGTVIIEPKTGHSYGWSRGTGYGQLYLRADAPTRARLHLRHSGIQSAVWLDGRRLELADDPHPPRDFPRPGDAPRQPMQGLTTEGLVATAMPEHAEPARLVELDLSPGWHSLLVKLVMQHSAGETFFFAARFDDSAGRPLNTLHTQTSDPDADLALQAHLSRIRPLIHVDAPGNLPRPGEPLRIRADLRWHPILEERSLAVPILPCDGRLRLTITDYAGNELITREADGRFPGEITFDLGAAPPAGYYAVYPALLTRDGRLVHAFYPDGFTVAGGSAAQRQRLASKKVWDNLYYAFDNGDRGFGQRGGFFDWLERSGVYRNFGSTPGFKPAHLAQWQEARQRGIELVADFAGDSPTLGETPESASELAAALAPHARWFKCVNEIDIHRSRAFLDVRQPRHWVERARWEHAAVHAARPDAIYVGGSLVRPGDLQTAPNDLGMPGPGQWFVECLKLGLDRYHDAWDVHAYPQNPPRFGEPLGNSGHEDERGVLAAYEAVGRQNTLPFVLGETGAKAAHGFTGRRYQAELTAKIIAWVNHRADYLAVAFCIGHEYDWGYGRLWDYSMGHKPGEAAMITASALIDGLPYRAVNSGDANIQAAWFGPTFMIWRTDEQTTCWTLPTGHPGPWVIVDVVGSARPLESTAGGVRFPISQSPVYVLPRAEYERLTRWQ